MNPSFSKLILSITFLYISNASYSQTATDSLPAKYIFTKKIELPASPVKDQSATGTCWSYATTSFLESEILRLKNDTLDLAEMFFVRKCYEDKIRRYIRFHGSSNFGEGGQAHDVINVVRTYGMMTNKDYSGLANGQIKPNHAEMDAVLKAILDALVKNPGGKLSPEWMATCNAVLDIYLGKLPEYTSWQGQPVTVSAFKKESGIDPDDYIELTSYSHHPFYGRFMLEVPDNWSNDSYYNVPVDDLLKVMDNALENGFTIAWDGDVSDKGFSHRNGVALVPDVSLADATTTDRSRWEKISEKDRRQQFYNFDKIIPEKKITQALRQEAFDNYSATDDHLMHITGYSTDQNGSRYYLTKNSWSAESNQLGGYLYLSVPYVKLNTIAILVHKDALPKDLRKLLKIN